jgi:hypothetical protein
MQFFAHPMRRDAMLSEDWRALARKYIAYDVFDEMAACFRCDRVRCPDSKYEMCPERLAQAAASKASEAQMPNGFQESRGVRVSDY